MAMEISVGTVDGVPVWAPGDALMDSERMGSIRKVSELDAAIRWMILDLKQVTYLSSAGIRSLVKLAKTLNQRKGRVIISGKLRNLSQDHFHGRPCVASANHRLRAQAVRQIASEEARRRPDFKGGD